MEDRVDFAISTRCEVFHYIILRNYSPNSERNCYKQTPLYCWRRYRAGTADEHSHAMKTKFIYYEQLC